MSSPNKTRKRNCPKKDNVNNVAPNSGDASNNVTTQQDLNSATADNISATNISPNIISPNTLANTVNHNSTATLASHSSSYSSGSGSNVNAANDAHTIPNINISLALSEPTRQTEVVTPAYNGMHPKGSVSQDHVSGFDGRYGHGGSFSASIIFLGLSVVEPFLCE